MATLKCFDMAKILFIDTETGGLDPTKHALLSVGVCVLENGEIRHKMEFPVRNYNESLVCEETAMAVNKIDLYQHNMVAISEELVVDSLIALAASIAEPGEKCVVAGHNVQFDIGFLKAMFDRCDEKWSDYFSHRALDTAGVMQFLSVAGIYGGMSTSLDAGLAYYGIEMEGQRHSAMADAIVTAKLFQRLIAEVLR